MMASIPCVLMRGGSSKGLYFLAADLPRLPAERDRVLLAAMGSPDIRQIDGLGGGDDQSSKVMIVAASTRPGIDVEYLFAQVSVVRNLVDVTPTSGNMLSGVAPFAIEHGLVAARDPVDRRADLRSQHRQDRRSPRADTRRTGHLSGRLRTRRRAGNGAPIFLRFLDPAGGTTGRLLPTGNAASTSSTALRCPASTSPIPW